MLRLPRFQLHLNVVEVLRRDSMLLNQALRLAHQCFDDHVMFIVQVFLLDEGEPLSCRRVSTSRAELVACMYLTLDEAPALAKTLFKSIEIRHLLLVEWLCAHDSAIASG